MSANSGSFVADFYWAGGSAAISILVSLTGAPVQRRTGLVHGSWLTISDGPWTIDPTSPFKNDKA